jgi:hypothetical protein
MTQMIKHFSDSFLQDYAKLEKQMPEIEAKLKANGFIGDFEKVKGYCIALLNRKNNPATEIATLN